MARASLIERKPRGASPVAPGTWHLDEMFVTLPGEPYLLWRAVDEHGARTGHPGAETALAFAALFGRFSLFDDLIAHGADPDHADARGNTALATVQAQGNLAAMEALRNVGATH